MTSCETSDSARGGALPGARQARGSASEKIVPTRSEGIEQDPRAFEDLAAVGNVGRDHEGVAGTEGYALAPVRGDDDAAAR